MPHQCQTQCATKKLKTGINTKSHEKLQFKSHANSNPNSHTNSNIDMFVTTTLLHVT